MTKRTRRLLVLSALALLVVGGSAFLRLRSLSNSPINVENFNRIQEGMTQAEVEAILGGPPGSYTKRPVVWYASRITSYWVGDKWIISIEWSSELGSDEVWVINKDCFPLPPEPFIEKCRRLLR